MDVVTTTLDGVLIATPPTIFTDHRGTYVETYNQSLYAAAGIDQNFIQDDISVSRRHVLRGLHGDDKTWKLVSCIEGALLLAVVNFDVGSDQYLRWETFELTEENRLQVLIPAGFANGHLILSDRAIFSYKQTELYDGKSQFTICWDDPVLGIDWPITDPILSERDRNAAYMEAR